MLFRAHSWKLLVAVDSNYSSSNELLSMSPRACLSFYLNSGLYK